MQALRPVLRKLGEELENRGGHLRVTAPDFEGAQQEGSVSGEDPLEQHHVAGLVVEGERDSSQIANQTNELALQTSRDDNELHARKKNKYFRNTYFSFGSVEERRV